MANQAQALAQGWHLVRIIIQYSMIPLFHHYSLLAPPGARGGAIVQNKANFGKGESMLIPIRIKGYEKNSGSGLAENKANWEVSSVKFQVLSRKGRRRAL